MPPPPASPPAAPPSSSAAYLRLTGVTRAFESALGALLGAARPPRPEAAEARGAAGE
eukprot:gene572-20210_t